LAGLGLAGCGGGGSSTEDGPTAEEEVKVAAVRAVENQDAASFCHKEASQAYLEKIYGGDEKKCASSEGTVPKHPSKAKASAARVQPGQRNATVTVSLTGGDLDGTSGAIEMVKEGGAWKVDDYDDAFVRSAFLASIKTVDEGAVSTPEMKACFSRQVKQLPAATIRHLTYASDADEQEEMNKSLLKMVKKCPDSALAEYGARTLTEGVHESAKHRPGYVNCLHKEIHFLLEVTGLTTELLVEHPSFAAVAALEGIVEGAKKNCGG
jgi:hypothetical protein